MSARVPWLLVILLLGPVAGPTAAQEPEEEPASRPESRPAAESRPAGRPGQEKKEDDEEEPWLAITGGDVHPVSGPVIRGGTVLIQGDEIVKVGRRVVVPDGAEVVDASGRHVCPGFVAPISSRIFGGDAKGKGKLKDSFDPFNLSMLMALSAGITTAHQGVNGWRNAFFVVYYGGRGGEFGGSAKGKLGGTVAKLTYGTLEGFEVREPAGVYLVYAELQGAQRTQTREVLTRAREYLEQKRAWLKALMEGKKDAKKPQAKKEVAAWARVLEGELPAFTGADDRRELELVLELSDAFELPLVVYGAEECWTMIPEVARRPVRILVHPRGKGFGYPGRRTRPGRDPLKVGPHGWSLETPRLLADAGMIWGTLPQSGVISLNGLVGRDIMALPMEAAFAVRGGVSNEEALRSITLHPARILGVEDRVGSLEPGKDADVLILDREPLDYRAFVEKAYVNGRLAYDKETCTLWSHVPTDRSKGLGDWAPFGSWPFPGRRPGTNGTTR